MSRAEMKKQVLESQNPTLVPCSLIRDVLPTGDPLHIRDYQKKGIMLLAMSKGFVLGDECGLGKTLQALCALCYQWNKDPNRKAVIITTKSSVPQWVDEADFFTHGVKGFIYKGPPAKREEIREEFMEYEGPSFISMNYHLAVQDFVHLQHWEGYILVTDEAAKYANPKTQVHKVISHLRSKCSRIWALTATVIRNHLLEGYGVFSIVDPKIFGSKSQFLADHCIVKMQPIKGGRKIPLIAGHNKYHVKKFREKISPYYLGRSKHEVAKELPVLNTRIVRFDLNKEETDLYSEALSGLLEVVKEGESDYKETTALTALIYCQQIVNHPDLIGREGDSSKLEVLVDLLESDLSDDKVIVFSRFKNMIDIIMEELKRKKIKAVRVTGDENDEQRIEARNAFQKVGSETRVICITSAGLEAINLQAAKHLIAYDTPWSAGDFLQLLGRMIRIGSTHDSCFVYHLIAKDSIDQHVLNTLRRKMKLVEDTLGKRIKGDDVQDIQHTQTVKELFDEVFQDAFKRGLL